MKNNYLKNKKCKICNKPITDKAIFCNSCERRNRYTDKSKTPGWKNGKYSVINYCINCHKKISSEAKRCRSCAMKKLFKNPKNHPHYKDGKSLEKKHCIDCGKKISGYEAKRCSKCNKKYVSVLIKKNGILKGKNHWNWLGGISKYGYSYLFNLELKQQIRKRDNYTCQLCFKKGKHIHHIDYNKQNCKKYNLITLCLSCNFKVNYDRNNWTKYFKKLIKQLKGE